jgi:HEPN domain-containing protein
MSPDNEKAAPGSPAQWITHAESDLRLARLGADDLSVLREQVCFHAQQAAEKALKAVLLSQGIEFPYTHDIKGLLKIAEGRAVVIPRAVQEAARLTPYAVESRRPPCGVGEPILPLNHHWWYALPTKHSRVREWKFAACKPAIGFNTPEDFRKSPWQVQPKLEPRILLEEAEKSYHAPLGASPSAPA